MPQEKLEVLNDRTLNFLPFESRYVSSFRVARFLAFRHAIRI